MDSLEAMEEIGKATEALQRSKVKIEELQVANKKLKKKLLKIEGLVMEIKDYIKTARNT